MEFISTDFKMADVLSEVMFFILLLVTYNMTIIRPIAGNNQFLTWSIRGKKKPLIQVPMFPSLL